MGSFATKLRQERSNVHPLTYTTDEGRTHYFFLLVDHAKEPKFLKLLESKEGKINLTEFGEILASGYGEPPKELIAEMEAKYNFEYTG